MPNLDVKVLRYMSSDEFRVLTACEMGMKNHEVVPSALIESISGLKRGGAYKLIRLLAKNKLVAHSSKPYDGYRLTSKGYDYLALKTLCKRGSLSAIGIQVGMGKESDIFTAVTPEGEEVALKLHKLGRSFRTLKNNRDYTRPGQSFNWLYMSRLSALKEYAFMSALHAKGLPVPTPIDVNRHCVVMSLAHGFQLNSLQRLLHPAAVFSSLMELICTLASYGLIHCDFNEFNLLIDDEEKVTLIDFPQMISTSHPNAAFYFDRDVECVRAFFRRRFGFEATQVPQLDVDTSNLHELDVALAASGWGASQQREFEAVGEELAMGAADGGEAAGQEDEGEEGSEGEEGEEGSEGEEDEEGIESEEDEEGEEAAAKRGSRGQDCVGRRADDDASFPLAAATPPLRASASPEAGAWPAEPSSRHSEDAKSAASGSSAGCVASGSGACISECDAALGAASLHDDDDDDDDSDRDDGEEPLPAPTRSLPVHAGQARTVREAASASSVPKGRAEPGGGARIADRVRQELRKKASARPGKGSRNEAKDRDRRKLAASVKREVSGVSGW